MAPRAGFLAKLTEPMFEWAALRYQANVGAELRKYGLRYDDLLDPSMNGVRTRVRDQRREERDSITERERAKEERQHCPCLCPESRELREGVFRRPGRRRRVGNQNTR